MENEARVERLQKQVLAALPHVEESSRLVHRAFSMGQEHIFDNWSELDIESRERLISQLARIDWEVLSEAISMLRDHGRDEGRQNNGIEPMPMRTYAEQAGDRKEEYELGREALIQGKISWIIPAGGSGSRLVKDLPMIYASLPFKRRYQVADKQMRSFDERSAKGQLPISPILGKTFYGMFIEQALALGARVNRMPVLIFMLSDQTREASIHTITNHPFFRQLESAIVLFDHGMNPVLDNKGRIIPADSRGELVFSGNGNGGMFKAMWDTPHGGACDIFSFLDEAGIEMMGFSNVDNPVSDIICPHMLGSHLRLGASLSFGVVKKADPFERVGMIIKPAGRNKLDKIEYNEFPPELAEARNPDDQGRLLYEHGDVNVFLMSLDQMKEVDHLPLKMYSGKQVATEWGKVEGNKFESFTFHIIRYPEADKVDVKEILREDQFMPTKNSVGRDSPATVIRALCTRNMRWLEAQGAKVAKQTLEGCLEDYRRLVDERLEPAARGTGLNSEVESLLEDKKQADINELLLRVVELGDRAQAAGLDELKKGADHVYSILQPGEAKAFVEFSPCFALEAEDLGEMHIGPGWELESGCQLALTGHPAQVIMGESFHLGRDSAFILDIRSEYGNISLSSDRWLTFDLDGAGSAEIGDNVRLEPGAVVEIHVHGSGRVEIPAGTVLSGEHLVKVKDGETVTLGG
ncbi:MAG: UTP--glucose-1-phosphate uridylyltransferase [Gemmatimonadota bacterium]|nr:UTP--glucose-1-phosphate uridylyltransferase [Gemmatimonadota bacterium]